MEPKGESIEALSKLSKRFRIIYLTTLVSIDRARTWLDDKGFPDSAVLKWYGKGLLDTLRKRGVTLYAIVASAGVLSEAESVEKRFSFVKTEGAKKVKDWNDLDGQLKE